MRDISMLSNVNGNPYANFGVKKVGFQSLSSSAINTGMKGLVHAAEEAGGRGVTRHHISELTYQPLKADLELLEKRLRREAAAKAEKAASRK